MQPSSSRFYEFGPFRVDTAKRVLLREGEPVSLSPKAFDTLLMLVQHAGEVLEKDRLMDLLWPDSAVEEANLPLNVSALRKALGETPNERGYITTIPGRGYRFGAAVNVLGGEEPDLIIEQRQRATVLIREHDPSGDAQSYSSERVLPAVASAALEEDGSQCRSARGVDNGRGGYSPSQWDQHIQCTTAGQVTRSASIQTARPDKC